MATTAQLITRISQLTGLAESGAEDTLMLQALNDAYTRSLLYSGANEISADYTFVSAADDYAWSTIISAADVMRVESLVYVSGSSTYPLAPKSQDAILSLRRSTSSSGIPRFFAAMGIGKVMLWPQPAVGGVLRVRYHQRPTALTDAGDSPSSVPSEFHWSVLLPGAVYQALQKDQRGDEAQAWYGLWQQGLTEFKEYVDHFVPQGAVFDESADDYWSLDNDQMSGRY